MTSGDVAGWRSGWAEYVGGGDGGVGVLPSLPRRASLLLQPLALLLPAMELRLLTRKFGRGCLVPVQQLVSAGGGRHFSVQWRGACSGIGAGRRSTASAARSTAAVASPHGTPAWRPCAAERAAALSP